MTLRRSADPDPREVEGPPPRGMMAPCETVAVPRGPGRDHPPSRGFFAKPPCSGMPVEADRAETSPVADPSADRALAPTPELLRELWAKAPVARAVLDRGGTVRFVNE